MKLGVIMDSITGINVKKDSTLAMLLAAQKRGWAVQYMEMADIYVEAGTAKCRSRGLEVWDNPDEWFRFNAEAVGPLGDLDVIIMRKIHLSTWNIFTPPISSNLPANKEQ